MSSILLQRVTMASLTFKPERALTSNMVTARFSCLKAARS